MDVLAGRDRGQMVNDLAILQERLAHLRGDPALHLKASVVIPVNAQKDVHNIFQLFLSCYLKGIFYPEALCNNFKVNA